MLQSLRTGITFQGRKAIAVCLDDISGILTSSPADIREAVRNSKSGGTHVARDFVPKQSTRCLIKKGLNSRSRKSTVIWEDVLPESLSLAANDGLCTTVLVDCCMFLNTATIVEVPRRPTTPPATQYGNGSVPTMGSNGKRWIGHWRYIITTNYHRRGQCIENGRDQCIHTTKQSYL